MKSLLTAIPVLGLACLIFASCQQETIVEQAPIEGIAELEVDEVLAQQEAETILSSNASDAGLTNARKRRFGRFTKEQNVFLRSTIAVADLEDPSKANATLPLYKGVGPSGDPTYYIITEAANFVVAKILGLNYAPKLAFGRGSAGSQEVTIKKGRIHFKGDVDFSPERVLEAGDGPFAFPPSVAQAGAVGDDEYSSLVVLPSGLVINAQIVANKTGIHDRIISIDKKAMTVTFELLDGFQGGDQFYYHLVTDATAEVPAAIELGTFAPRMALLPEFGLTELGEESTFLAFSPVTNGPTGVDNPERQSLSSTILDNDLDPINVFPFDPDNNQRKNNNYSPMWDAHLNQWTDEAINGPNGDVRRRITSFEDLQMLIEQGLVESFVGSGGEEVDFVFGLRNSGAMINCPVIAQPFETEDNSQDGGFPFGQ